MAPSTAAIEKALKQTVRKLKQSGEDVTVNAVRKAVENDLDLDEGYFKDDAKWKTKSKEIITAAFDEERPVAEVKSKPSKKRASTAKEETPRKKSKLDTPKDKSTPKAKPAKSEPAAQAKSKKSATTSESSAKSKKTASSKIVTPKAKSKTKLSSLSASDDDDDGNGSELDKGMRDVKGEDSETSAAVTPKRKKSSKPASTKVTKHQQAVKAKQASPVKKEKNEKKSKKKAIQSESESEEEAEETDGSSSIDSPPRKKRPSSGKKQTAKPQNDDDSEDTDTSLANAAPSSKKTAKAKTAKLEDDSEDTDISLIDEAPSGKRKKEDEPNGKKKSEKRKSTSKAKPTAAAGLSADEETIKTLQKQLTQCGIRKLWHRELADYETSRDKIRHLKKMLEDAGMTGRFSSSRAAEIKEARELQADLESATDFQRNWGYEGDAGRGRRARTSVSMRIDDASSDEEVQQQPRGGTKTGLVDFGDSGDSGSEI